MYHIDNKDFDEKDELRKENNFILNLDIDGFNGPLDLLLQLAQTKKLDITKISILELVDQYLGFIKKVKDYKTEIPKNIHEKVYFKYMKFFFDKNSKKKEIIEDKIWKNIETNAPGTMQYSQEMIDRLNTEYEPVSKSDWYDDWKYN